MDRIKLTLTTILRRHNRAKWRIKSIRILNYVSVEHVFNDHGWPNVVFKHAALLGLILINRLAVNPESQSPDGDEEISSAAIGELVIMLPAGNSK